MHIRKERAYLVVSDNLPKLFNNFGKSVHDIKKKTIYLKELQRERETEREASHWFTLQIPAVAGLGLGRARARSVIRVSM